MSNDKKVVLLERVGATGKIIKIKFLRELTPARSAAYIAAAFNKCFKHGVHQIIVDMEHINSPHNNFIATIIEATNKVRRKNGDIKIINVSELAKQTMAGFNAYSFLTIGSEE